MTGPGRHSDSQARCSWLLKKKTAFNIVHIHWGRVWWRSTLVGALLTAVINSNSALTERWQRALNSHSLGVSLVQERSCRSALVNSKSALDHSLTLYSESTLVKTKMVFWQRFQVIFVWHEFYLYTLSDWTSTTTKWCWQLCPQQQIGGSTLYFTHKHTSRDLSCWEQFSTYRKKIWVL